MGGVGSGRRYQSGKDSTSDYRNLDVRRLQREGRLTAGQSFQWQWSRRGETVAAIDIKTHADHVILSYRQRRPGEEWQSFEYPVRLTWTPCTLGGERLGLFAQPVDAADALLFSIRPTRTLRVGTATSLSMNLSGKTRRIVWQGAPTRSASGSAGSLES